MYQLKIVLLSNDLHSHRHDLHSHLICLQYLLNVFKLTTFCKNKNKIADTIPLTWIRKFHIYI
jgi:hypothetical protein